MKKANRYMVNAFPIGEYEFRNLLSHMHTDETIKLVADCEVGDHDDYDCFITYEVDFKKNNWKMVLTNNNGLRVVGINNIMKKVWGEDAKPFKAYELPLRIARQFGYIDDPYMPIRYAIG